jgi:Sec-independent protein translocase protein TatA
MIKKLMKNPKKIMDLMKTVSGKLDSKMKNGEISKDEIMQEASELFGKMKDMGGTEQFAELFKNLTKSMGGMGKNMRMDTNAIDRMTKQQSTRERMLKKLEQRKREAALQNEMRSQSAPVNYSVSSGQQPNNLVFKVEGETQEKSYIHPDLLAEMEEDKSNTNGNANPSKKNKKKKSKK